jgi:hypothetical protein
MTDIPLTLPCGHLQAITIDNEPVVLIGSEPSGYTVLISRPDWKMLNGMKLCRLSARGNRVRALSKEGRPYGYVANLLTGNIKNASRIVAYRNSNPLDLRRSNLILMQRGRLKKLREQNNGR